LKAHVRNAVLLPYILDALASLLVGNDGVAQEVSGTYRIKASHGDHHLLVPLVDCADQENC